MSKFNYEPDTNCTYLTTNYPAVTSNICTFVFLLKSFFLPFNSQYGHSNGHCIGRVKVNVLQMDIFNTYVAYLRYIMTFFQ